MLNWNNLLTALAETTATTGTTDAATQTGGMISTVIMLVLMVAIFYFLLIRPENKKKKAAAKMRSELAVGDEITTIGGVVGTICQVKEDTIIIETSADRVRMEFTKWAISTKGTQSTENAPADTKDSKDKK